MSQNTNTNRTQYEELQRRVNVLLQLLHLDLDTANSTVYTDYTGDEKDTHAEIAFTLGVYEECLSQARKHIAQFEDKLW